MCTAVLRVLGGPVDNWHVTVGSLAFWVGVILLAVGIGFAVAWVLYIDLIFPTWDYFRPPPGQPEGPSEWRKMRFSLGIGALVAVGITITIAVRHYRAR